MSLTTVIVQPLPCWGRERFSLPPVTLLSHIKERLWALCHRASNGTAFSCDFALHMNKKQLRIHWEWLHNVPILKNCLPLVLPSNSPHPPLQFLSLINYMTLKKLFNLSHMSFSFFKKKKNYLLSKPWWRWVKVTAVVQSGISVFLFLLTQCNLIGPQTKHYF